MAEAEAAQAEKYSALKKLLDEDEWEEALEIVDTLLGTEPADVNLLRTRALCLIRDEQNEEAIELIGDHPELGMGLEHAYALYSLHRSEDAMDVIDGLEKTPPVLQLEAQAKFRMGDYDGATAVYEKLRKGGATGADFSANVLAAFAVSGRAGEGAELFRQLAVDTFEGVYNGACAQINAGQYDEARDTLAAALKMGQEQLEMEDYTEEEIADELSIVDVQLAYVNQMQGDTDAATEAYSSVISDKPADVAVLAVARNNAVAIKGERDLFDGFKHMRSASSTQGMERKFNKRQQKVIGTNNALVLLFMGKNKECREAIDKLNAAFPDTEHVAILYAALAYKQKSFKKCEDLLRKSSGTAALLTLAQFYSNQRKYSEAAATVRLCKELQHEPATVATIVGLFDQLNDKTEAVKSLDSAVAHWKKEKDSAKLSTMLKQCAAYKLKRGMPAEALKTYGELIALQPKDHQVIASAIVAAAHVDPSLAKKYQLMLPPLDSAEGFDGEELEASVAPRIVRRKKTGEVEEEDIAEASEEAAKRKKKKKKIRYPKSYDPETTTKLPDPERWVPRHQRAGAKKIRKKRTQSAMSGNQGGSATNSKEAKVMAALDKSDKKGSSIDATTGSARQAGGTPAREEPEAEPEPVPEPAKEPAAAKKGGGGGGGGGGKKKGKKKKK